MCLNFCIKHPQYLLMLFLDCQSRTAGQFPPVDGMFVHPHLLPSQNLVRSVLSSLYFDLTNGCHQRIRMSSLESWQKNNVHAFPPNFQIAHKLSLAVLWLERGSCSVTIMRIWKCNEILEEIETRKQEFHKSHPYKKSPRIDFLEPALVFANSLIKFG